MAIQATEDRVRAHPLDTPDIEVSVRQTFGLDTDMSAPGFSTDSEYVPEVDEAYVFDHDTTMAILAGFAFNRRVLINGYHGTGKSTHVAQEIGRASCMERVCQSG